MYSVNVMISVFFTWLSMSNQKEFGEMQETYDLPNIVAVHGNQMPFDPVFGWLVK